MFNPCLRAALLTLLLLNLDSLHQVAQSQTTDSIRLRILSYNIHHGAGVDGKLDLERIANVINDSKADIVALQEVDRNVPRSGRVDQAQTLAELTKTQFVFGENIDLQGGVYGNAILSRFPIVRFDNHHLPNVDDGEQRGVLVAEIKIPGFARSILFLGTHFDHRQDSRERHASAGFINTLLAKYAGRPAVLAGDLNDTPGSVTLSVLGKRWKNVNDRPLSTIPVDHPSRQIDFILTRNGDNWRVVETKVLDEKIASDHRPILTVLELPSEQD